MSGLGLSVEELLFHFGDMLFFLVAQFFFERHRQRFFANGAGSFGGNQLGTMLPMGLNLGFKHFLRFQGGPPSVFGFGYRKGHFWKLFLDGNQGLTLRDFLGHLRIELVYFHFQRPSGFYKVGLFGFQCDFLPI